MSKGVMVRPGHDLKEVASVERTQEATQKDFKYVYTDTS